MRSLAILAALSWASLAFAIPYTGRPARHENSLVVREPLFGKTQNGAPKSHPEPDLVIVPPKGGANGQKVDVQAVALKKPTFKTTGYTRYTEEPDLTNPKTPSGLYVDAKRDAKVIVGNDMPNLKATLKAGIIETGIKNKEFTAKSAMKSMQRRVNAFLQSKSGNRQQTTSVTTEDKNSVVNPVTQKEKARYDVMMADAKKLGVSASPAFVADPQGLFASRLRPTVASPKTSNGMNWFTAKFSNIAPAVKILWYGPGGKPQLIDPTPGSQGGVARRGLPKPPVPSERRSVLDTVSAGDSNPTADAAAEFELYLAAFQILQCNISDAIFPFLEDMTSGSNSSLVYNAAWSIWADLTAASEHVEGPFSYGQHCFDDLEDQYAQAHNLNENDVEFQDYLAVNSVLIDLYTTAWNASVAAVNGTGWLLQLAMLASNMMTNDTSIQTANFDVISTDNYDDSVFAIYNQTMK